MELQNLKQVQYVQSVYPNNKVPKESNLLFPEEWIPISLQVNEQNLISLETLWYLTYQVWIVISGPAEAVGDYSILVAEVQL